MKAAIWTQYGPPEVIQIGQIDIPAVRPDEILIKIHASTLTAGDCEMRRFDLAPWLWLPMRLYMGIRKPRIKVLGQELSGEVVKVGSDVKRFVVGDKVIAPTKMSLGAHAEYIKLPASFSIAIKPDNISYEEGTTLPTGGLNAIHFINKANIKKGDHVLINGAGGSIGTYAIQLAKRMGAKITSVDAPDKLELLQSIGAEVVINYKKEDFTKGDIRYDVIIDVAGNLKVSNAIKVLNTKGRFIQTNPNFLTFLGGLWYSFVSDKKAINALAPYKQENLDQLVRLMHEGTIKSIIDKTYPLEQIVEAHCHIEKGLKQGNTVITIL